MELRYELKQKEVEESLLCLNWKKEGKIKNFNVGLLGVITIGCLSGYIWDSNQFYLIFLAGLAIGLMFLLLYGTDFRRKRKAKQMVKAKGIYKVTVPRKDIRKGFESEQVFTIQTSQETYCIPKRILGAVQKEEIRQNIRKNADEVYEIKTGRERDE